MIFLLLLLKEVEVLSVDILQVLLPLLLLDLMYLLLVLVLPQLEHSPESFLFSIVGNQGGHHVVNVQQK